MFTRILIANRGEIARRIIRTCHRLGVETVAVHSDADAGAPHVREATTARRIGPEAPALSYLNGAALIAAAVETGAEAIHPGYGFLSENAAFARAVEAAGLVFIGPGADVIDAMGDKARAKALMQAAGVPTVPGFPEASADPDEIAARVAEMGFPVLLKPVAGGGGKGMRVLRAGDDVRDAAAAAARVATGAFGDGRLLVERYVERPRHIEVQVFGDAFGSVVHLFERECSLQRRHQKIIEEAPALRLSDDTRARLLHAAVEGARAIGYRNAGTFEFIVGADEAFYFLEVNTRLQVEHPVTEAITGLDLVEWQLQIADGAPLPLAQDAIRAHGHAIEARIYAEDAEAGFRPAPGRVLHTVWPHDARTDAAVEDGSVIGPAYDPMVAKLITHGADRAEALARLRTALAGTALVGLTTNLGYLAALAAHPDVVAGTVDTGLVDRLPDLLAPGPVGRQALSARAAVALAEARAEPSPWTGPQAGMLLDRPRLDATAPLGILMADAGSEALTARLLDVSGPTLAVGVDEGRHRACATRLGSLWYGTVDDRPWWGAAAPGGSFEVQVAGLRRRLDPRTPEQAGSSAGGHAARAPLPGVVSRIDAAAGAAVAAGQRLAIVEAMKMEIAITAPRDGVVAEVLCALGASVVADQVLFTLAPQEEPE